MNRERTKELLPVMKEYSEGKTIWFKHSSEGNHWLSANDKISGMTWFNDCEYITDAQYQSLSAVKPIPPYKPSNEDAEENLINLMNEILRNSEPLHISYFNKYLYPKNNDSFVDLSKKNDKLVLAASKYISSVSLIATIANILTGKKLITKVKNDHITGFEWEDKK